MRSLIRYSLNDYRQVSIAEQHGFDGDDVEDEKF